MRVACFKFENWLDGQELEISHVTASTGSACGWLPELVEENGQELEISHVMASTGSACRRLPELVEGNGQEQEITQVTASTGSACEWFPCRLSTKPRSG